MAHPPLPLRFVTSATRETDLPDADSELAIVGRSNVGKSSLINAVANRANLAKASKTPGRTQLLNYFELATPGGGGAPAGRRSAIVDLPGYGYAKAPGRVRATWPAMIEGYLLGREELAGVVLLVDAEVGPTSSDLATIEWLDANDLVIHLVATKHDKVRPSRRPARKKELAERCGVATKDVLWVSAAKNVNIDELRSRLLGWLDEA